VGAASDGFFLGSGSQNSISASIALACTDTAFVLLGCSESGIVGCTAKQCAAGAAIANETNTDVSGNFITGITIVNPGGSTGAIYIGPVSAASGNSVRDTVVSAVVIRADASSTLAGPAISVNGGASTSSVVQGLTISDVTIDVSAAPLAGDGILLGPSTSDVTIVGSSIAAGPTQGSSGVLLAKSCTNVVLNGLRISPTPAVGSGGSGFGIQVGSGCSYVSVQGCLFKKQPAGAYSWALYAWEPHPSIAVEGTVALREDCVNGVLGSPAGTALSPQGPADSSAANVAQLVNDFNALLTKLRAADVFAS
jgi:hypothetical protein